MGKGGENNATMPSTGRKITMKELSEHRIPSDAWISYKGKVYDVSNWYDHPGGSVIFTHAGDDCTDIFTAFHPSSALKDLSKYEIGELVEEEDDKSAQAYRNVNRLPLSQQREFEKAYRKLQANILAKGLYNASYGFYVYKVLSNLCIAAVSILCAVKSSNLFVNLIGAVLLGLFWQQSGWLAHDFLHHQVFKNRLYGDLMGLFVGGVCQGFSVQWWKSKHNSHHAVPNLEASCPEAADGDPDIDTMPILAWTNRMAKLAFPKEKGGFGPTTDEIKSGAFNWRKWMITNQAIIYFPVLLFARLAWAHQSWVFVWGGAGQHSVKGAEMDRQRMKYPTLERIVLVIHYAILLSVMFNMSSAVNAVLYFLVAQTSCGLFLALVFGVGHNGMSVYPADQRPDFWKLQVTTTRNVTSNPFVDWFCGGLQYQVEHHLFPMIPRHNLPVVHRLVEQFCKEQGVTYHEAGIVAGNIEILQHLSTVSREFLREFPAM